MVKFRKNGIKHGVVFTKKLVVRAMLDLIGYSEQVDLSDKKIVEPSAGQGVFVFEILERLYQSSIKYNFSFEQSLKNILAFEVDGIQAQELTKEIQSFLTQKGIQNPNYKVREEDYLLADYSKVDFVIGNPPYIRWDNIPIIQKEKYKKKYATFNSRSDIYIAFYEKGISSLKDGGQLCYLCSNRWFKNTYGKSLRKLISTTCHVNDIIDLEQAEPFEEKVIAYPSITTITKGYKVIKTNFYKLDEIEKIEFILKNKKSEMISIVSGEERWLVKNKIEKSYLKYFDLIESQGFKIKIGVATGNDKIFIQEDFESKIEEELLIPIITSKELKGNTFRQSKKKIINPFNSKGDLIDLTKYPKVEKYFSQNKEELLKRHISKKNSMHWYRTIDKIDIKVLNKTKILLPDITGNNIIFIDKGKYYPHHNLYYILGESLKELKLLAALLMSDFVYAQLLEIGNKMNGGYPRWQSQNLRKLRIPSLKCLNPEYKDELIAAYDEMNLDRINSLVQIENLIENYVEVGQMHLFEPQQNYSKKKK